MHIVTQVKDNNQEGDIVVVQDSDLPRGFWMVARVTKLLTGRDGRHRGAVVRVAARGEQATTLQRPLQLLYPLEINCNSDKDGYKETKENLRGDSATGDTSTEGHDQVQLTSPCTQRFKRASALKAQERFKQWSDELLDEHD